MKKSDHIREVSLLPTSRAERGNKTMLLGQVSEEEGIALNPIDLNYERLRANTRILSILPPDLQEVFHSYLADIELTRLARAASVSSVTRAQLDELLVTAQEELDTLKKQGLSREQIIKLRLSLSEKLAIFEGLSFTPHNPHAQPIPPTSISLAYMNPAELATLDPFKDDAFLEMGEEIQQVAREIVNAIEVVLKDRIEVTTTHLSRMDQHARMAEIQLVEASFAERVSTTAHQSYYEVCTGLAALADKQRMYLEQIGLTNTMFALAQIPPEHLLDRMNVHVKRSGVLDRPLQGNVTQRMQQIMETLEAQGNPASDIYHALHLQSLMGTPHQPGMFLPYQSAEMPLDALDDEELYSASIVPKVPNDPPPHPIPSSTLLARLRRTLPRTRR